MASRPSVDFALSSIGEGIDALRDAETKIKRFNDVLETHPAFRLPGKWVFAVRVSYHTRVVTLFRANETSKLEVIQEPSRDPTDDEFNWPAEADREPRDKATIDLINAISKRATSDEPAKLVTADEPF